MGDARAKQPDPVPPTQAPHPIERELDRSAVFQQASSNTAEYAHAKYVGEYEPGWNALREEVPASSFDSGHGAAQRLAGKANGDGGFGDQLSAATADAAAAHAHEWGLLAAPVEPVTAALEAGIAVQTAHIAVSHGHEPDWVMERRAYSHEWAKENIESMQRYEWEQAKACTAYNHWCPIANASHLAERVNEFETPSRVI